MKCSIVILGALFGTVALAPSSSAQGLSRMSVGIPAPRSATTDTAVVPENTVVVIAVPESLTIDTVKKIAAAKGIKNFLSTAPGIQMQNYRPEDKRGINVFEAPKDESLAYEGFKLQWGA
ncbi:MAG TPA: hypothetical protein VK478_02900, partial [Gemmatimonadaceae bacterium]|nr:hypothetical protein [Gemmatimonadaceae bacterium]